MAKRTVGDWDGEGKREAGAAELDEALSALSKSMAAQAKELAARLMESGSSAPRVDGLVREAVLEAGRRGLWRRRRRATVRTAGRRTRRGKPMVAGLVRMLGDGWVEDLWTSTAWNACRRNASPDDLRTRRVVHPNRRGHLASNAQIGYKGVTQSHKASRSLERFAIVFEGPEHTRETAQGNT